MSYSVRGFGIMIPGEGAPPPPSSPAPSEAPYTPSSDAPSMSYVPSYDQSQALPEPATGGSASASGGGGGGGPTSYPAGMTQAGLGGSVPWLLGGAVVLGVIYFAVIK